MALNHFIDTTLTGPVATLRRQAIGIAIAAAACIGAIFYFASAAQVALEPEMGPVAARLFVGGAFVLLALVALALPRMFHSRGMIERARAETEAMSRDEKFALIVEALLAGFSLTSRRSQASK